MAELKKRLMLVIGEYQTLNNEFEESQAKVQPLIREITLADDEINRMGL